ncbi:AbrB/MazE/SpoVT family DNA-binding domain-containing protein [Fimbriimonas ginsengisoli]|uniref:AbrB/MazE/SpoVT family DNA-binding domain-containing protein n=1 Tax=Fimbriimonas ginsengisoli TaxID=1005039 RepID=UPI00046D89B2|nr:AbrB/MazE/SpoVT family DNA-binding domain-containing protein [Fimbriimonas ginsengisoli]
MESSVDRFGRIVIPKKMRDRLGMHPGTPITIEESEGKIEITVDEGSSALARDSNGHLVLTGKLIAPMKDFVATAREDRMRQVLGVEE